MKRRRLLLLGEWQARELRLRDVLLLATVVVGQQLYIAKVNKPLCAVFSTSLEQSICVHGQTAGYSAALQPAAAATWNTAKRLSCGCVLAPSWLHSAEPEGPVAKACHALAAVLVQVVNTVLQVLFRPYTLGWAVGCPLMFAVPVLVTLYLALLLLPIPCWSSSSTAASPYSQQHASAPSSSHRARDIRRQELQQQRRGPVAWLRGTQLHWCSPDWYWRVPGARVLLVVVFRACLSVLPPLSVGPLKPAPQLLQFNGYLRWSPFVQYAWRGWGAFTQLLPWRLQVVVCAFETLGGLYMTAAAHPGHMTRSSGMLVLHLACSLVLCFALPVLASVIWENMSRKQYARYKAEVLRVTEAEKMSGTAADAWLCDYVTMECKQPASTTTAGSSQAGQGTGLCWQGPSCMTSSPPCRSGGSSSSSGSSMSASGSSAVHSSAVIAGSRRTSADAAAAADAASDVRAALRHKLRHLVGSQVADSILSSSEVTPAQQLQQSPMRYSAASQITPVTIKVDNHHGELDAVGPLLRQTLEAALSTTWGADTLQPATSQQEQPAVSASSSLSLQCICFRGCVQLLASVYRPRRPPAGAPGAAAGGGGYSEDVVAQRLLQLLQARSTAAPQPALHAGRIGRTLGLAVGDSTPAVSQQQGGSTGAGSSSSSSSSSRAPQRIQLLWQDIPALTAGAGNQQQPVLVLDLEDMSPSIVASAGTNAAVVSPDTRSSSSSPLVGSWARLMIFSDKQVLFDQLLQLQAAIRLSLPALDVGAYHLAILRHEGEPPTPQAPQGQAVPPQQQQQQPGVARTTVLLPKPQSSPGAVACPLLLQPLVVLPQGPAEELQQLWNAGCQRLWAADRASAAAAGPPPAAPPHAAAGTSYGASSSSSAPSGPAGSGMAHPASLGSHGDAQSGNEPLPSPMRAVQVRPDGTWFALSSTPVPLQKLLAQRHLVLAWQHMMCALLQDIAFLLCWADGTTIAGPVSSSPALEAGMPGAAASSSGTDVVTRHTEQRPSPAASTTAAPAAAAEGVTAPAGEPPTLAQSELLHLQVVLQPLLHYLATHRMWALADFLVQILLLRQQQLMQLVHRQGEGEEVVEAIVGSAEPAAAATGAGAKQLTAPVARGVAAPARVPGHTGPVSAAAMPGSASEAATTVVASSSEQFLGLRRRRGTGAKGTQAAQEQEAAAAVDRLAAAQPQLEVNVWQRHSLRQLFRGFASPQLETGYIQYAARMSQAADVSASLLTLMAAPPTGVGADLPAIASAVGWPAALWQQRQDLLWLLLFVVPAVLILMMRSSLMYGRRREAIISMAELGFILMWVSPLLGWMSQTSTSKLCVSMSPHGWRSLAITTSMSIFKPLSRQVRLQVFMPMIVVECTVQALFQHLRCGHSLLLAAARYCVIVPVAICCCVALERRRRWMFLQQKLAQQASALQQRAAKRAGSPGVH